MARDYYAEARVLAAEARRAGLTNTADGILSAIEDGFTATEILMAIRTVLLQALPALAARSELKRDAVSLITGIDEALTG